MFSSEGLRPETKQLFSSTSKKKGKSATKTNEEEPKADVQPVSIHLHFKRYVFDPHKKMVQSWPLLTFLIVGALAAGSAASEAFSENQGYINLLCLLFFGWRWFTEM